MNRRNFLGTLSVIALGTNASQSALAAALTTAKGYPNKAINYIVAYTPGSANDILVRLISPQLGALLGQTVVVVNKPGAGGSIGMAELARLPIDGYNLGLGSGATMAINPALFSNLPYNPLDDFFSITKLATSPNVLVVSKKSSIKSLDELIELIPKEKLFYSSGGNGTTQHLTGVMFNKKTGGIAEHVPYKGPAEAVAALVGDDQISFGFVSLPSAFSQIKAGQLRALAVTPVKPSSFLPGVPSLTSAGLTGFEKTDLWFGTIVKRDTPKEIVEHLNKATSAVLTDPAVQASFANAGYEPAPQEPLGAFNDFVLDQTAFWAELVKQAGAKIG